MENASKALVMAGSILIGVILLSIFVFAIRSGGEFSKSVDNNINQVSIAKFNAKFESILIGDSTLKKNTNNEGFRKDLTWYEVTTLLNLAKSYENKNEIIVKIVDMSNHDITYPILDISVQYYEYENKITDLKKNLFECKGIEYNDDGRINKIYIKKL